MQLRQKAIAIIVLIGLVSLTLISTLVHLLTESWWFDAVGFADVFWTRITWQIIIWVATFAVFSLFLWFNYWLADRLSRDRFFSFLTGTEFEPYTKTISRLSALVLIFTIAISAATKSAKFWLTSLKFINATDYDRLDPIYGKNVGFYLFKLPFYQGLQTWLFTLLVSGLLIAIAVYLLKGVITLNFTLPNLKGQRLTKQKLNLERQWQSNFQSKQKTHIILLLAAIAVTIAIDFWLKRYDLLYSADGVVLGCWLYRYSCQIVFLLGDGYWRVNSGRIFDFSGMVASHNVTSLRYRGIYADSIFGQWSLSRIAAAIER